MVGQSFPFVTPIYDKLIIDRIHNPVLKTISPVIVVEYPNPIPSNTEPSLRISFPFLLACCASLVAIGNPNFATIR